jgi:hypothetical protein
MLTAEGLLKSLGFIIISPEPNVVRLRDTVRSIRMNFGEDSKIFCSVAQETKKPQIDEMKRVCPCSRGGNSITSLMNQGMSAMKGDGWRMFLMEGVRVPRGISGRYSRWIKSEKDVIFPITINHDREGKPLKIMATFEESTLNGMLIHSGLFGEVGEFSENPIVVSKSFWAIGAMCHGASFKGVLGVKII